MMNMYRALLLPALRMWLLSGLEYADRIYADT